MMHMVLRNDAVPRLFMPNIYTSQTEKFDVDGTESLFGNQNLVSKEKQKNDRHKDSLDMLARKIKKLSMHPKKHLQLRFAPKPHYIQPKKNIVDLVREQLALARIMINQRKETEDQDQISQYMEGNTSLEPLTLETIPELM